MNNTADIGGGFSFVGIMPIIEGIHTSNNQARKGEHFGADS